VAVATQVISASDGLRTGQSARFLRSSVLPDPSQNGNVEAGRAVAPADTVTAPHIAPGSATGYRPLPMMPASSERRNLPAPNAARPRPARWLSLAAEATLTNINSRASPPGPGSTSPHTSDEGGPGDAVRTWLGSRTAAIQSAAAVAAQPMTNMLPPRLATPAPGSDGNAPAGAVTTSGHDTSTAFVHLAAVAGTGSSANSALTSLGRRTQAREARGRSSARDDRAAIPNTRGVISTSVSERLQNLDDIIAQTWITSASTEDGLARAQAAIEGSRTALSQARDAIRNALVHSER
jgi:hypothetical protein